MDEFSKAFGIVCDLVEDFKQNEKIYLAKEYQEAEVRKDFIDKLFIALGWDVLHNSQKNPYEQEVKVEKGITISGAQKRADYSFSLGPNYNDPKFFVEAKKPSQDLYNPDYYFQTIRYGWHKATPLAVLTDFEEFHILDCRFSPDITTILSRQISRYHYLDYCNKDKFAEIYWLFSREAVAQSSLEKKADTLPRPRGKSVQKALFPIEKHLTIDDAFLEEIDSIRERLAKAFKKNDENLNGEELTEATQKTIDRLVFIRFLEDKLIEQEHYIHAFGEKGSSWNDFIALCKRLDAKYNGIVFKKGLIDNNEFKGPVDSEFYSICQNICHLNSRFLFNEIPIHILGSIYERFLGKVVHATDKRVKVEEKPEVRKAGGVFYTPKYIVDYIIEKTVGEYIKGKTPEQISKIKIADIACGSGSFLIGAFSYLLDYHSRYYQSNYEKAKKDGCINNDGVWVLSIRQKQDILKNNIFGVDIDNQAVEVTQLSLSLKLLEDETTATANEMQVLFHEKILPDMTKNIICGNSLVDTDIFQNSLFTAESQLELNPLDFKNRFQAIFASGGFDIIIGNPPYVLLQNMNSRETFDYATSKYVSAKYKIDAYQLFIERSINLIKKNGVLSFITPNSFFKNIHSEPLRNFILSKTLITEILNFTYKVFKNAQVDTCILTYKIGPSGKSNEIPVFEASSEFNPKFKLKVNQETFNKNTKKDFNIYTGSHASEILNKIGLKSNKLGDYCNAYFGIQTFDRKKYVSTSALNKNYKPVIDGGNIYEYHMSSPSEYVLFMKDAIKSGGNPDIYNKERICIRQIGNIPICTLVNSGVYTLNTIYNVYKKDTNSEIDLCFLLGILNSKVCRFYWSKVNSDQKVLFPKIKKEAILSVPIPIIELKDKDKMQLHKTISNCVSQIIETNKILKIEKTDKRINILRSKIDSLKNIIDEKLFTYYCLTQEEIKAIDQLLIDLIRKN